mmetsp:Transcript_8868/g.25040  ORF Transcript_8868/g.25040 Transcript_8868/m.25040 type:complete len:267 (-) Transcript_8868:21-821(-)
MMSTLSCAMAVLCLAWAGATAPSRQRLANGRRTLLLSMSQQAAPGREPETGTQAFDALDANHDGRVGFEEVAAFSAANGLEYASTMQEFASFDTNHDGALDAAELSGALGLGAAVADALPAAAPRRSMRLVPLTDPSRSEGGPSVAASPEQAASFTSVANGISLEYSKVTEAEELERKAAELRANATVIARRAEQAARDLAAAAAQAEAGAILRTMQQLQNQTARAQIKAAALRAKASAEMQMANDLMFVSGTGLGVAGAGGAAGR